jgi:hypothetical protein
MTSIWSPQLAPHFLRFPEPVELLLGVKSLERVAGSTWSFGVGKLANPMANPMVFSPIKYGYYNCSLPATCLRNISELPFFRNSFSAQAGFGFSMNK